jgi:FixJ family two-component response regulator
MTNDSTPIVYVIDTDLSVRDSLDSLIRSIGLRPKTFASGSEFISQLRPLVPSCIILNLDLPDISGLQLQELIAAERRDISIIFLSACCDISATVKAMKRGALEFLMKPFDMGVLSDAIHNGIRQSHAVLSRESQMHTLRAGYSSLTPREREVMCLVASGLLNKQVGGELGISEITVKAHRGNVMRKMKANSFADLVNMADRLRVVRPLATSVA